jgi:hypothetical protein
VLQLLFLLLLFLKTCDLFNDAVRSSNYMASDERITWLEMKVSRRGLVEGTVLSFSGFEENHEKSGQGIWSVGRD